MGKLYSDKDSKRPVSHPSSEEEPYRTPWRRDYGRLVHSPAFRRLAGKTQLFPGPDSDFFRTRLTHSLEVAQIAKSIAIRINNTHEYFKTDPIDTDIVETAALAHDLGHPPFGHNGEHALDQVMSDWGGFEGNAQTLRILCRLEKRQTYTSDEKSRPIPIRIDGQENRAGLNLTYRTLAAVLKYDQAIPARRADRRHCPMPPKDEDVCKGYYESEKSIVADIKAHVGNAPDKPLRTIECSIMDVADDIAYSTYDLEDAFKANFLTPVSMMSASDEVMAKVAKTVSDRLGKYYSDYPESERTFSKQQVVDALFGIFSNIYDASGKSLGQALEKKVPLGRAGAMAAEVVFKASANAVDNGYSRATLTSELVGAFIRSVQLTFDKQCPTLSQARLEIQTFKHVEVLKNFAFQSLIMSPRLKVTEHRGQEIITRIFEALTVKGGELRLPDDVRLLYDKLKSEADQKRMVCDFIACMTDRYALQFYNRLFGTSHETIYAPI